MPFCPPPAQGARSALPDPAVSTGPQFSGDKMISTNNNDLFATVPNPQSGDAHRREAVRIRALAADATTPLIRRHLEDRARAHEQLAGPDADLPR
jgi:hypothetical protein